MVRYLHVSPYRVTYLDPFVSCQEPFKVTHPAVHFSKINQIESFTDPGGDRCGVRHRHLPRDHRQHLCRLRVGSHQEQLSGGDHGYGGLHQLLHHHAP